MNEVKNRKSLVAFQRALELMPGGVNSPARAFGAVGGTPRFIERAEGAYLYDLDGQRYIDYLGSWGPMILGHAQAEVVAAVKRAAERGTSFGAPTEAESELAELIIAAVPSIEKVRLVNSGTEATMSAIRLARAATRYPYPLSLSLGAASSEDHSPQPAHLVAVADEAMYAAKRRSKLRSESE